MMQFQENILLEIDAPATEGVPQGFVEIQINR